MAPIKEWFGVYTIIFDWFFENYGYNALVDYWRFIAESCYSDLAESVKTGGLNAIKNYLEEIFTKDNGSFVSEMQGDSFVFEVTECPEYTFFNSSDNPALMPREYYCMHHEVMNTVLSEMGGFKFKMTECGNNGRCKWVFRMGEQPENVEG